MADFSICLLKGDGIGPEIIDATTDVLKVLGNKYGHTFNYTEALIGGASIDAYDSPLTDDAIQTCKNVDAVLLGAVGGPKWDSIPLEKRPERGLLKIRKELNVYSNLRLSKAYPSLIDSSPLKKEIISKGFDVLIVRELTSGIYFGEQYYTDTEAFSKMYYNEDEVKQIATQAFEAAKKRNNKVTNVDKSNVLAVSRLWRKVVTEVAKDYPEVELEHLYVDYAAMRLVTDPSSFDVIVTSNMFGDILSDEAAVITGSIGLLPSASLGDDGIGLYEPVHGSAPDISGLGISNPMATILSAAMMLEYSFGLDKEAAALEAAVEAVISAGYGTKDICKDESKILNTNQIVEKIKEELV